MALPLDGGAASTGPQKKKNRAAPLVPASFVGPVPTHAPFRASPGKLSTSRPLLRATGPARPLPRWGRLPPSLLGATLASLRHQRHPPAGTSMVLWKIASRSPALMARSPARRIFQRIAKVRTRLPRSAERVGRARAPHDRTVWLSAVALTRPRHRDVRRASGALRWRSAGDPPGCQNWDRGG